MMGLAVSERNILTLRKPMRLAHSMVSLLGLGAVHAPALGLQVGMVRQVWWGALFFCRSTLCLI